MVHPYYDNYPSTYYQFHHHFLSRFALFALSVAMIVMAILDYVYVHQTWYTITINAVTIFAGVCGILCCIFVSFTLLEFTCLMFFILFGVQLASLIYRGVAGVPHNSWGYGIAMCAVLLAAWIVSSHLIRWFYAEIIGGTYVGEKAATGGGATTNVAITQPQPNQQPMIQPSGYGQTTTTTTGTGLGGTGLGGTGLGGTGLGSGLGNTQYGADPTYGQQRTYTPGSGTLGGGPTTTYTTGPNPSYTGPNATFTGGPNAAYPQQRTYPAGTVQV